MQKLAVCLVLAAAACSGNALSTGGDGGGGGDGGHDPCAGKTEAQCQNSQACVADYCFNCTCTPGYAGCRLPTSAPPQCPALGCPQPFCGCEGLSELQCLAADPSMGCTATYCPDCDGKLTIWNSCGGPTSGAPFCPPPSCPGRCRAESDCAMTGGFCYAPGEPLGCGICMQPPPCMSDAECGLGDICAIAPCTCTGESSCTPGCSSTGCPEGQTCGSSNHCIPLTCGQCPPHFLCGPTSSGACVRQTCNADFDCGFGFCVKGECYDALGMCTFPPA
jgi:hypothetical protein